MNQEVSTIIKPETKIIEVENNLLATKPYFGFVKIWKSDPKTGESTLLVDKKNTILYGGADLLAQALAGQANTGISHMYLGYSNDVAVPASGYTIARNANAFSTTTPLGYLRTPLTFPATFMTDINYANNIVVFTVLINNAASFQVTSGSPATLTDGTSKFFEAALVASVDPTATVNSHANDRIFARIAFERITYDASFNLTISWGVRFLSQ